MDARAFGSRRPPSAASRSQREWTGGPERRKPRISRNGGRDFSPRRRTVSMAPRLGQPEAVGASDPQARKSWHVGRPSSLLPQELARRRWRGPAELPATFPEVLEELRADLTGGLRDVADLPGSRLLDVPGGTTSEQVVRRATMDLPDRSQGPRTYRFSAQRVRATSCLWRRNLGSEPRYYLSTLPRAQPWRTWVGPGGPGVRD